MKNLVKDIWNCDIVRFVLILTASALVFGLGLELGWIGEYTPLVNEIGNFLKIVGTIGFLSTIVIAGGESNDKEVVYVVIVEDEEEL